MNKIIAWSGEMTRKIRRFRVRLLYRRLNRNDNTILRLRAENLLAETIIDEIEERLLWPPYP